MYSSLNQPQSSYSKRTSYLLLFAVLAVLLLSVCELSYANFRAGRMLEALRMSESK
jgi:ABC-type branched-subunit amino acid transport system permease subunit